MARLSLSPLGQRRDLFLDDRDYEANQAALRIREDRLRAALAEVEAGWGERAIGKVHRKGKLTTRERIERLKDEGSRFFPINSLVNYGRSFDGRTSPGAGLISGFIQVEQRWCVLIANDNTVASGSWWPQTPEKIQRAQEIALKLRLPVLYLVDCSGLYLPEQSRTYPGKTGAGHIFKKNAELSAAGVPQIAGVFGDCIAGGGYMPIISDKVYMTERAYMVIAGAALIKGAKAASLSSLDIGGADVHVHLSGCADDRVPDDPHCLAAIRAEVARLPSSAADYYRYGTMAGRPGHEPSELSGLFPGDFRMGYDIREVLARLVDQSLFWEFLPEVGREMVCGVARVGGLWMGFIANDQALRPSPEDPARLQPGGILYRQGIAKTAQFSRACNDDGIPIIWLQDISGFDIGTEAERNGLLGYGSSLIYANSTNQTPMITVLLRKASGAGYYALAGMPYDPVLQLATAISRLSVMEGRTLAIGTCNADLDENFEIASTDPEERARIAARMAAVEERIEGDMDPLKAASQMDTDEVIEVGALRSWLEVAAELCYQSAGTRRIKNPRIWSLHDLAVLDAASAATEPEAALPALLKRQPAGVSLQCPAPGHYRALRQSGDRLVPGQTLGILTSLGRRVRVVAPKGAAGVVPSERWPGTGGPSAVDYGTELLRGVRGIEEVAQQEEAAGAEAATDGLFLSAPMAGVFYQRPSPDEPAYVSAGDRIGRGRTVGLLEAMKVFNPVKLLGEGLPEQAEVLEMLVEDGEEVAAGQPLLRLKRV